jgi:hypothetical protein
MPLGAIFTLFKLVVMATSSRFYRRFARVAVGETLGPTARLVPQ